MQRRQLLKNSAFTMLSFSMARDLMGAPLNIPPGQSPLDNSSTIILRANENPHGPSPLARVAMQ